MKNSRKLSLLTLLFLSLSAFLIIPDANSYWYFYDLALLQLNDDSYPDVCVLSDELVFKGNAFGPTTDTYFYLTTLFNRNTISQNTSDVILGIDSPKYVTRAFLSTGDLNNDGYSDMVATSIKASTVLILFQKPDSPGAFNPPLTTEVSGAPQKTAIGDLNADGLNDIAIPGTDGNLTILLNDRSNPGQFLAPSSFNYSGVYVDIGDLNADLQNDIALAGADNVVVFFQDPLNPGNYLDPLNLIAGEGPSCLKIADMDGDGFNDIVAGYRGPSGNFDSGSISIFFQDRTVSGTFLAPTAYSLSCEALDIDVGDLNSDGLLDIAVATQCAGASAIKLFFQDKNDGRTFSLAQSLSCEEIPAALKIADMDQDDRNDIIVSDWDVKVFYQSESKPGDFSEQKVILKSELSDDGGGSGGGGDVGGGAGCFISIIAF